MPKAYAEEGNTKRNFDSYRFHAKIKSSKQPSIINLFQSTSARLSVKNSKSKETLQVRQGLKSISIAVPLPDQDFPLNSVNSTRKPVHP